MSKQQGHSWGAWIDTEVKVEERTVIRKSAVFADTSTKTTTRNYITLHQVRECKRCFLKQTTEDANELIINIKCIS